MQSEIRNIPFFIPTMVALKEAYMQNILANPVLIKDRYYSGKCLELFNAWLPESKNYLTKSCTQSLELAAHLLNIGKGDEIILPSFAFVADANAFVAKGATCKFVDIRPDTMNIDETKIEAAISEKTRAIVTVNYAGVSCNYESINAIASKHRLAVVEDNAHGIMARYKGNNLGSFGDISCMSFDYFKNITCGEGGSISINDSKLLDKAQVMYELGTNKVDFLAGKTDHYEWKGIGSNYTLSEILAAFLLAQFEQAQTTIDEYLKKWNLYFNILQPLQNEQLLSLAEVPQDCEHNGHIFYIKVKDKVDRKALIAFLKNRGIFSSFHYTPLHQSEYGKRNGTFVGEDVYTTKLSESLLRLPLYYELSMGDVEYICSCIFEFYGRKEFFS